MKTLLVVLASFFFANAVAEATPPAPHFTLHTQFDLEAETLSSHVEIELARERAGDEYRFLLGPTFDISHFAADGAEISVEEVEGFFSRAVQAVTVRPGPDAPDTLHIRVEYSGPLTSFQELGQEINSINQNLIELSVDSLWVPFPQEFNVGMTAEAEFLGIASDAAVVSTGTVTRDGDVVRISLTRATDLAIIASPNLQEVTEGRLSLYGAEPESTLFQTYQRHGPVGLAYLEELLGPMPLSNASVIMVRRTSNFGYNRPGYMVVVDRVSEASETNLALSLVHEMAHAWWSRGNFLGEDYWLVEGPAQYYTYRYSLPAFGQEQMEAEFRRGRDAAREAGPTIGNGRAGSVEVYQKPATLLRQLELDIGTDRFDRFMRDFANQETHTTALFLSTLAAHTDQTVADRFESWLRAPGLEGFDANTE